MLRTMFPLASLPQVDHAAGPTLLHVLRLPADTMQGDPDRPDRARHHRWWWCVAAAMLMVGSAQPSAAQFISITKQKLAFSDTTPTASFTVVNTNDKESTEVWFNQACAASQDSAEHGDPIADAWRNTSSCVAPWLVEYPQHLLLAPNERRTLVLRMAPPPTLPDGHYTTRLIWATDMVSEIQPGQKMVGVWHDELAITYNKGPQSPRPARTQWRATLPARKKVALVDHAPAALVLDSSKTTATFTLHNPGSTSTEVWLAVDCPWFRVNFINYPESHQYESAWHGRIPNLALWLSGYPQHLTLAPHERRTISIQAFPLLASVALPKGSYYARLIYVQSPVLSVTAAGDTTYTTPRGEINVVYHKGAVPPQFTLSQLQRTPQPDGTSRACVMVQQPGIGAVAVLHAEVDDANGHPVHARASARNAKGAHPAAWGVDTTVSVWRVTHHDPLDTGKDGGRQTPDPICVTLPSFAPGHYQFVVSAYELEDTAKRQPVQATLPLEVP